MVLSAAGAAQFFSEVVKMLAVGQTVVYGTQGVCTVKEISMLKLGKTKGEY